MEKNLMREVLEELKNSGAWCIFNLIEYDMGMSDQEKFKYILNNKDKLPESETQSPFWNYHMYYIRYCYGFFHNTNPYQDIHEKVLYDYSFKDNDILRKNEEQINQYLSKTRRIIWKGVEQEKALLLYGKIPNDILNEILSFL